MYGGGPVKNKSHLVELNTKLHVEFYNIKLHMVGN